MKKLFRTIFRLVFLGIFVLFCFAGIDYYRMTKGKLPVFQVTSYNSKTREQTFTGTFYKASRIVRASPKEVLEESSSVQYFLLGFPIKIQVEKTKEVVDFLITPSPLTACGNSKLYYADKDIKVYLYCLEDLTIQIDGKNESFLSYIQKDPSIVEEFKNHLSFMGVLDDHTTLQFDSIEENIRLYQCNSLYVPDIYIGPNQMAMQSDFCVHKDDDFLFLAEILDTTPDTLKATVDAEGNIIPEVFYEDEVYRYEFQLPKSSYVFITTPAVRGKEETKTPLKEVLDKKILTIDQVAEKGLSFDKIDKEKEREEIRIKEEEERQKTLNENQNVDS